MLIKLGHITRSSSTTSCSSSSTSVDTSVSGFLDVFDAPCHVTEDCIGGSEDRSASSIDDTTIYIGGGGAIRVSDCCKAIGFE